MVKDRFIVRWKTWYDEFQTRAYANFKEAKVSYDVHEAQHEEPVIYKAVYADGKEIKI